MYVLLRLHLSTFLDIFFNTREIEVFVTSPTLTEETFCDKNNFDEPPRINSEIFARQSKKYFRLENFKIFEI